MKTNKILFAHIPKTAGTSFRTAVEDIHDKEIIKDYGPHANETSAPIKSCYNGTFSNLKHLFNDDKQYFISGHFQDTKLGLNGYKSLLPDARTVTFLRDPIERVISEYWHFKERLNFSGSFPDFIKNPAFIDRQGKSLSGVPIETIDFVGITSKYNECLEHYNKIFKTSIAHKTSNKKTSNTDKLEGILDGDIREFCKLNTKDISLYNKAIILAHRTIRERILVKSTSRYAGHIRLDEQESIVGWAVDYFTPTPVIVTLKGDSISKEIIASEIRKDLVDQEIHISGYAGFRMGNHAIKNIFGKGKVEAWINGSHKIGSIVIK